MGVSTPSALSAAIVQATTATILDTTAFGISAEAKRMSNHTAARLRAIETRWVGQPNCSAIVMDNQSATTHAAGKESGTRCST